ncbi:MAG: PPOX class F420-dependent oxidoreductase [Actinomycetota bacterium]|nr:PPOX class F420-dependent oxidoreductase [Actinomycetota bacterium]
MATSIPQAFADLVEAQYAILGTFDRQGRPHLSPVWFLYDDGVFKLSLHVDRQKVKNLRRNRAASVLILDLQNPLRYLEVRSDAHLEPDEEYTFADKLAAKYGGIDLRQADGPGGARVVVTIRPEKVVTVDLSA